MAKYNLTLQESRILVSWLFEPNGYLDSATLVLTGQTAKQALTLNPLLDLIDWIYSGIFIDTVSAHECAMVWWIWKNDNINNVVIPIQKDEWRATLTAWADSISSAFNRVGAAQRDSTNGITLYGENGSIIATIGAGTQLLFQQSLINKLLTILV